MKRAAFLFTIALLLPIAPLARAGDKSAAADALFRQGRRAADRGDWATACERFEQSQAAEAAPGTLLNLADCEETRGQLTRAWRDFLALADALPETDERKAVALERARRLERSMPKLRVRLAFSSIPARVYRDGVELGQASLGVALPVDPGMHVVLVHEPGFHDRAYTVPVARGDEKDLEVEHGAQSGDAMRTVAWALGGVGLASLAAGTTTGVLALTDLSASNGACIDGICANPGAVQQYDRAQSLALASDITLGVGAALVVTSIVLLILSHGHRVPVSAHGLALASF